MARQIVPIITDTHGGSSKALLNPAISRESEIRLDEISRLEAYAEERRAELV